MRVIRGTNCRFVSLENDVEGGAIVPGGAYSGACHIRGVRSPNLCGQAARWICAFAVTYIRVPRKAAKTRTVSVWHIDAAVAVVCVLAYRRGDAYETTNSCRLKRPRHTPVANVVFACNK